MSDLQELFDAVDVTEWLDYQGIDWRKAGAGREVQLKTCPFCGDDRWRVYFSVEKKLGVCFHADCGKRFNMLGLVKQVLGCEAGSAINELRRFTGIPRRIQPPGTAASPSVDGWTLPESIALPAPGGLTHPYLLARKILLDTQALFGLRWCENGHFQWRDADGETKQTWFGNRIILPVHDLAGNMVSFVGRDVTNAARLRYLFPPVLPSGGAYLYGAEQLGDATAVVIGEGPFDAIGIHQAIVDHPDFRGVRAAASFGLALGDGQLSQLRQLRAAGRLQRATLLWDGEPAALERAMTAASKVAAFGLDARVGLLPPGFDPGELDTNTVRDAIAKARPWSHSLHAEWLLRNPYR